MTTLEELLGRYEAATGPAELAVLCSDDPSMVVFDADGNTYRSREHWARRPELRATPRSAARDIRVEGHTAWVTYAGSDTHRTSLVLVEEDGLGWRIAHVHTSPATPGPRPGGI